jgi:pimeloyl-ACP methyl ester carboxylesterase
VPSIWAHASVDGDWFGSFERPDSQVFVLTHFVAANGTGTIDLMDLTRVLKGKPLSRLDLNRSRVHFELFDKASQLSFEGKVTDAVMTGVVEERGRKFPLRLDWMAKTEPSRYEGIYEVGPRHFIKFGTSMALLYSFDFQSAQIRLLLPRTETDFVCGPGLKTYPEEALIHFTTNRLGKGAVVQWKPENGPVLAGKPMKLPEEEVTFKNGETTLAGTLVLPPTKGSHPAVVLIHGSGPGLRNQMRFLPDFFALNGVAALVYDKRGCGASSGDWRKSGFDDLAGDGLAGLELLKNRADINPRQIGLWGISQGGWLVGLAASRSTNVAFIIGVSGPGITPEAQGAFMVEHRMKAAGFSEADLREALSLYQSNSRCAQADRGWDEFEAACKAVQEKPWYNGDVHPYGAGDPELKQWQLIWDYDPIPVLRKVHCPVLSIFGAVDPLVPAQKSADIWKDALAAAGNHDVTIKVFPGADHGITETRNGIQPPEFFTLQREWLLKHVAVNPD